MSRYACAAGQAHDAAARRRLHHEAAGRHAAAGVLADRGREPDQRRRDRRRLADVRTDRGDAGAEWGWTRAVKAVAAAAPVAIAKIKSADIAAGRRPVFPEHQIQQQDCDQHRGEHAPGILLAIGEDLRTPTPEQELLHGGDYRPALTSASYC